MSRPLKLQHSPEGYSVLDISDEEYREVVMGATVYRIDAPKILIMRTGGKTHRVVDANGVAHCYPAPETGVAVIRWKARRGKDAVKF